MVPDIAQSTHGIRNIFVDIRNVPARPHMVLGMFLLAFPVSHHVFATATCAPRIITDTVWSFSETAVTLPAPDAKEMLIAAIKDFSRELKQFNLTGNFAAPTLVQDLEALAALHNSSPQPCTFPINDATVPVVVQPKVIATPMCEPRVATPKFVQETRAEHQNPCKNQGW